MGVKLSLVIPAYNECAIIVDTLKTVMARLARIDPDYEVIVVDDGSTDGMAECLYPLETEHFHLERYAINRGKGCAVRTGMLLAKGDYVFCTDADLAYGLEPIVPMLDKLEKTGCDVVIGSRRLNGGGYKDYPPLRLITSKGFGLMVRLLSGLPYDTQCGIKGYRRASAQAIFLSCKADGFAFDFEVLLRARKAEMRVEQEAVSIVNHRDSKINLLRDSARMFRDLLWIKAQVKHS